MSTRRHLKPLAVVLLLASVFSGLASATEKPLWELGVGLSALSFPDYRGSDESGLYAMPFPYLVYRGDFLKADRNGIRGTFFDSDRVEFNVSFGASLPVSSDDNVARRGMPDLKPTVEIGPSLDLNLWRTPDRRYKLDLRLPVRTAITLHGGMRDIGWVFSPRFNLDITDVPGMPGWNLGVLAGPMYGSKRNHEYSYSVDSAYATAARPAYDAKAGYAGSQFLLALSKRYPKYWVGAFARWDTLDGAAFAASPLVKSDHYFAAGIGIAWVLGESTRKVEAED
jgi:outer membrane scaffolding protein for murein synthesis (MipA/OmpV family)